MSAIAPTSYAEQLAECWNKPAEVLVIEDDPALCKLLQDVARRYDCQLHFAPSGEDGIRKLQDGSYSLILLDVLLPGMDGREVFRHIIEQEVETPVCVMTGMSITESIIDDFYRVGWCTFCRKPQDFTLRWFQTFFASMGIHPRREEAVRCSA